MTQKFCEVPPFVSEALHKAEKYEMLGFAYHKTYFIAYLQNEA